MKNLIILLVLIIGLIACEQTTYDYIDKNTWYKFEIGDTLIYNSDFSVDSFQISNIDTYMLNSDKTVNYEVLKISAPDLKNNCKDYCFGISIRRQGNNGGTIEFRNISRDLRNPNTSGNTFQIGSYTIGSVYTIEQNWAEAPSGKNVGKIWYTHLYGIIAYQLLDSGEVFTLDEKCLEPYME